jgi:SAM-dependent methyltransferase
VAVTDLTRLLDRWRADLASWAIPGHIMTAADESPWVLPQQVFARRADRVAAAPVGASYDREWAALDPPGSVLDVGSGAGAACLPLIPRSTDLIAVDVEPGMLAALATRSAALGRPARCVPGNWPEVAASIAPADLVTCHNVLYNVPDLAPFIAALTVHARRLVVAEVTAEHPLVALNPLWLKFHGLRRPVSPTAEDLIEILTAMDLRPACQRWSRPGGSDYASFAEVVDVTRRRLCLPREGSAAVADALIVAGIDPAEPADLGSGPRQVVTIWWTGCAGA